MSPFYLLTFLFSFFFLLSFLVLVDPFSRSIQGRIMLSQKHSKGAVIDSYSFMEKHDKIHQMGIIKVSTEGHFIQHEIKLYRRHRNPTKNSVLLLVFYFVAVRRHHQLGFEMVVPHIVSPQKSDLTRYRKCLDVLADKSWLHNTRIC